MLLTNKEKAREWVSGLKVGEVVTFEKGGNFYAVRVVDKARDCGAFSGRGYNYSDDKSAIIELKRRRA